MVDNFYFLYIDEIYTPNLNQILRLDKKAIFQHKNHWHFGLGGIIISPTSLADINNSMRKMQSKYYPKKTSPIMHYNDILSNKNLFSDLKIDKNKRQSLIDSLNYWIKNQEFSFLASFIDIHELVKKFGIFDKTGRLTTINKIKGNIYPKSPAKEYNLYSLALKFIMKEFYGFLSRKKYPARGLIIAEQRGQTEDIQLGNAFLNLQVNGISTISAHNLKQTIVDLLIINKKYNYAGLQLADLLLYPTYDSVIPNHGVRNDHLISYDKLIKKKLLGDNSVSMFP